jgi:signal peptidase I
LLDDGQKDYVVKRVIGLPGEIVQFWRGQVFINRQMLVEPYLPPHTYTYPTKWAWREEACVLGEEEYFVLGDNRLCSSDSRVYGAVSRKQIKRRVPLVEDSVSPHFAPYALPAYGKMLIRRVEYAAQRARAEAAR